MVRATMFEMKMEECDWGHQGTVSEWTPSMQQDPGLGKETGLLPWLSRDTAAFTA